MYPNSSVTPEQCTTWIEISASHYRQNMAFFRKLLSPEVELCAVVKSNAYGHGMLSIARLARENGARSFCVHALDEALELRRAGFREDVLIMGPVLRSRLSEVIEGNFRLAIFTRETLQELDRLTRQTNRSIRLHLKLETGTHRQGMETEDIPEFLEIIRRNPLLILEAAYTHFANIEDTTNHEFAFEQLRIFREQVDFIRQRGFPNLRQHTACSAAILLFRETHFDMVRLGISQYGLWPSRETLVSYKTIHQTGDERLLAPVLTWKTRVTQLKTVRRGQCIGYGCTYQTTRDSRIAVLPVGYADGYDRRLSNQSYVLIKGQRAPVRGRICMNLMMVDITDIPGVELEEEVVLLGQQGRERITAEHLASLVGTINYEFVTRINWGIPRFVVD